MSTPKRAPYHAGTLPPPTHQDAPADAAVHALSELLRDTGLEELRAGPDRLRDDVAVVVLSSPWFRERLAQAWDEGRTARPRYLGPDDGHYNDDCAGWEDCRCGTYINPYRDPSTGGTDG